jgi:DNA replication and repair protein RecF
MQLNSLHISHLRNLNTVDLDFNSEFNIFWGENGGGKTSLLEAIHVLTTGRSFRAHQPRQIITFGKNACTVSGVVSQRETINTNNPIRMGVERYQTGGIKMRLADQDCHSIALLAKTLPIQLINSDSYDILEASPQFRRQFLDWAMFHVEHSFYSTWQCFKRALQQRNAALKTGKSLSVDSIRVWDKEFYEMGEIIDFQRKAMLAELLPLFSEIVSGLLGFSKKITVQYQQGWNAEYSLREALDRYWDRDFSWGYTTFGPQRADLEFMIGGVPAKNVLSRGQSKLFICALLMARAALLYKREGRRCIFLIDDLNSELDEGASKLLIGALSGLGGQVLITSIEGSPLVKLLDGKAVSMYWVKDGKIG